MRTLQIGMRVRLPYGGRCWGCGDARSVPTRRCETVTVCGRDAKGDLLVARRQGATEWVVTPLEVGCVVSVDGVRVEDDEAC